MLVSNGVLVHRYQERKREGQRLGRHLELDARSLPYTVEAELEDRLSKVQIKPAEHMPNITTLDQGQLGSCTGNAGTYGLGALVGSDGVAAVRLGNLALTSYDAQANERFAVELYSRATTLDGFPGSYPPDDEGSSGLGVARALKAAGLIKGYKWATTLHGFAVLLQSQGCEIGMPWYNAFFDPDPHGFIDSSTSWQQSGIAGGHELYVEALETWVDRRPEQSVIRFANSWSDAWGDKGRGRMTLGTYVALRQQIDVKSLVAKAA